LVLAAGAVDPGVQNVDRRAVERYDVGAISRH
jgi:hypothetical protein